LSVRRSVLALAFFGATLPASAKQLTGPEAPIIARGVANLKGQNSQGNLGEGVLCGLTLLKCEVKPSDPALQAIAERVRGRIKNGVYTAENDGGSGIYETGIAAMFLANMGAETYRPELQAIASTLIQRQNPNGSWDYRNRSAGDTSISQYAILGLWEASNAGVEVDPAAFDRAALWLTGSQRGDGGWIYHPDEGQPETPSMTAAGTGSLLICLSQLQRHFKALEPPSPLMIPLFPEGQAPYEPKVTQKAIEGGVRRGIAWLAAHFTTKDLNDAGQSAYYALYGIERVGALASKDHLGSFDWYRGGFSYIQSNQQKDGSWQGSHGTNPNTCWALLFLTKSTAQSVKKIEIKRLAAGTLLGGRGLPSDLSTLTVAGGRVMVRPMNGAIEGMLAVLEDPRSDQGEAALAGLVEQYHARGPAVLRPLKDRFRKLMTDRDPGSRSVAAWALGRIGDLDVVPLLIKALRDPDPSVVTEARGGLQFLSRKLDGYGPPAGATPEQLAEAVSRWHAWYDSVRPPGFAADDR
jgi:hypothetical protein